MKNNLFVLVTLSFFIFSCDYARKNNSKSVEKDSILTKDKDLTKESLTNGLKNDTNYSSIE